jgi:hypothetical protein
MLIVAELGGVRMGLWREGRGEMVAAGLEEGGGSGMVGKVRRIREKKLFEAAKGY